MNYNTLRYFSVLAQVEHYTLAAARLGISQPSLSSAIRNSEYPPDRAGAVSPKKGGRSPGGIEFCRPNPDEQP